MTKAEYREELMKEIRKEINAVIKYIDTRIMLSNSIKKIEMLELCNTRVKQMKKNIEEILK